MNVYLAIDIGASSGRHIAAWREDGALKTEEVYRFPNGVKEADGHLTWDVDTLLCHVKEGIAAAKARFGEIRSLAVDTWGVDYVLLNGDEEIRPVAVAVWSNVEWTRFCRSASGSRPST